MVEIFAQLTHQYQVLSVRASCRRGTLLATNMEPNSTRSIFTAQSLHAGGILPKSFRVGRNMRQFVDQRIHSLSNSQDIIENTIFHDDDHSSRASGCQFCSYPCQAPKEFGEKCKISSYLEEWHNDSARKPYEFDQKFNADQLGGFEVAVVSLGGRQGDFWKTENQDDFFVFPIHVDDDIPHLVIGVFDGHGENGRIASKIARNAFVSKLESFVKTNGSKLLSQYSISESLIQVLFKHTTDIIDSYPCNFDKSGTTAVVCIASPEGVTSGWVGDSRAIVGLAEKKSKNGPATQLMIPLTQDHKPDPLRCPEEAIRVTKEGGRIDRLAIDNQGRPTGPFRVFLRDRWIPGLAVSRAFGDHIAKGAGIISSPDITSLSLKSYASEKVKGSRQIMILGTDGLWEWIDNQDAMELAWSMNSANDAAHALAEMAQKNWALYCQGQACDDVTVAVVYFP